MSTSAYAEIGITTNFSFLRGGSDPRAYVHQASKLGIPVIDGVAAAVRFAEALVGLGLKTAKHGDLAFPLRKARTPL